MDDQGTDRKSGGRVNIFWTLISISGLPLLLYPWVLFANLMSLLAQQPKEPPPLVFRLAYYAFILSTTLYPVVFFACGAMGWNKAHWGSFKSTVFWAIGPLLYLLLIVVLFMAIDSV
jgi:hypothetical protein